MKPKPLKKQDINFVKEGDGKINFDGWYAIPLVKYESAVEWLKQEINVDNADEKTALLLMRIYEKIDKAFHDVTKNPPSKRL